MGLQVFAGMLANVEEKEYKIEFMQIYLSKPTITESDGETSSALFPKEARPAQPHVSKTHMFA